jgi:hypothetical protein
VETGEETDFGRPSHFVGDAWEAVFGADDAMVCGIEGEFYGLCTGLVKVFLEDNAKWQRCVCE